MKKTLFAVLIALLVAAGTFMFSSPSSAVGDPGTTPDNPIVLASLADAPEGAVQTGQTTEACATTTTFTKTVPAVAETFRTEYRFKRSIPAQAEVSHKVYSYKKTTPAVKEVKEYTFDKFVQRQKAKWNGNTYVGPISPNYSGSYTWRDAGFAPVTNTTGVLPTAPGPVRGEFIHNSNGTWYYTLFYEYRKISERVVTAAQPEKVEYSGERTTTLGSPWVLLDGYPKTVVDSPAVAGYTEFYVDGKAPSRVEAEASWIAASTLNGWTQFGTRQVSNNDAQPAVVTYYAFNDGKVCVTETPTPTPTPPVPTPPTTPPTPETPKVKSKVSVDTRCTGTTYVKASTTSETPVIAKMKAVKNGKRVWTKTVSVTANDPFSGKVSLPNKARVVISIAGDRDSVKVPNPCAKPPHKTPHTGKRQGV